MSARTILNVETPTTQSVDAIKALLSWRGRAADPLPQFVELGGGEARLVLVLSNKKDAYYTCTQKTCSCPAAIYHHGPCKHQRKYFPEAKAATKPTASIMPKREPFRPFLEDEARLAKVSSPLYVDCLPDATNRDIAYHSIKADREMWPAE